MKYVIRFALLAIIAVLGYLTFDTVYSEIKYTEEVEMRENAVIEKMKVLRDGQMLYKDQYGQFTKSMDTLLNFMQNGQLKVVIQDGDADDSTTVVTSSERYESVKETQFPNVDIANLRYVPYQDTLQFLMDAGEIRKNNVVVPVFEIVDPKPFSKDRIKNKEPLKVGSIYEANYNGNWK